MGRYFGVEVPSEFFVNCNNPTLLRIIDLEYPLPSLLLPQTRDEVLDFDVGSRILIANSGLQFRQNCEGTNILISKQLSQRGRSARMTVRRPTVAEIQGITLEGSVYDLTKTIAALNVRERILNVEQFTEDVNFCKQASRRFSVAPLRLEEEEEEEYTPRQRRRALWM